MLKEFSLVTWLDALWGSRTILFSGYRTLQDLAVSNKQAMKKMIMLSYGYGARGSRIKKLIWKSKTV